ncbi:glycosyltransferase [Streptomyces sp. NBC_01525]|uniref:Glycosyltransferase family 1 protein n=1 Tax=Streptomyces benahoarensis TaxID=2595054 RepID=A0A553Z5J8_9ACTN|nr:glycosyltransferase [Streptomyces benahoarensis]TSB19013.1 glycosyltransferase family 1 protein [Streptomyces benahoarensis]TSB36722.1 glycosyltransferase family 1 protein [Streptomyces benahoarensis]
MRVLCTSTGSPSHGRAMLPLARALAGAGHAVTVAASPEMAPVFRADAVTLEPRLASMPMPGPLDADAGPGAEPENATSGDGHIQMMLARLTGDHARAMYGVLAELAAGVRPDVIIRDGMDMAGIMLAERLGIPHLPIPSGLVNMVDPAQLLPDLNRLRRDLGLPEQEDAASFLPYGRFDYLPEEYAFARFPAPVRAYRQTTLVDRTDGLPGWVAELPADRPLVFAAIGTALPMILAMMERGVGLPPGMTHPEEMLRATVEGLSRLHCSAIVATGGVPLDGVEPAPHVRLVDRLAQPLLLECADLLVTHGGYNSVREAVRTGTPMAVLPNFGDQPHNAARVAELGLGRHVTETTPDAVAAACQDLLEDRDVAARVRRAHRAALALPEVGQVAADLEKLVRQTR